MALSRLTRGEGGSAPSAIVLEYHICFSRSTTRKLQETIPTSWLELLITGKDLKPSLRASLISETVGTIERVLGKRFMTTVALRFLFMTGTLFFRRGTYLVLRARL